MLDEGYIEYIIRAKEGGDVYGDMRKLNAEVFILLEKAFAQFGIQLVDFKLEYGLIERKVTVIDEITGGSFRLWPYAKESPNLNQPNVLSELDPSARLDKDTYRKGESLDHVQTKFEEIARMTAGFKDLKID